MNNLTPKLSQEDLKANIDAILNQGKSKEFAQSYVDNYAPDGQGGYILKTAQVSPEGQASYDSTSQSYSSDSRGFVSNFSTGVVKGELSTAKGLGTIGQKFLDQTAGRFVNLARGKGFTPTGSEQGPDIYYKGTDAEKRASEMLTPQGAGEKTGYVTEKIAEFFLPSKLVSGQTKVINASHMPETLKAVYRIGLNTVAPTAVATAQQGEINKEVGKTAAYAGAFSALGEGINALAKTPQGQQFTKWLTEKVPGRKLNKIIRPSTKEFDFAKNPGQTVAQEGIVANTRGDFLAKIAERKQEVGSQIDDILNQAGSQADDAIQKIPLSKIKPEVHYETIGGKAFSVTPEEIAQFDKINPGIIDAIKAGQKMDPIPVEKLADGTFRLAGGGGNRYAAYKFLESKGLLKSKDIEAVVVNGSKTLDVTSKILDPIKAAKAQAVRSGDKTLFARLTDLEEGLTKEFGDDFAVVGDKALSGMSPKDVQQLKINIGKDTRWTGQAFDNDINKVRVAIYRGLNDAIETVAPGTKALNSRYAGLLTAEKALERSNRALQRAVELGLRSTGVGAVVGGASAARGDSGPVALLKGVLGAGAFQVLGTPAIQTRVANFYTNLTPDKQAQFVDVIKNIYLGVRASKKDQ